MFKNRAAAAYYEAGRAVALKELGAPVGTASVDNAPRLRPASLRKIVGRNLQELPPVAGDAETELFSRVVGVVAMERSGIALDRKLKAGIFLETLRFIHALPGDDENRANATGAVTDRARKLVTWRWHAIEHLAKALLAQRTIPGEEVAALLNAA